MVSLFSLVPHSPKNSLRSQYQSAKRNVANSWKLSFWSIQPRNCLQPPGSTHRLPFSDLSKGQVLTGIGIHVQSVSNHCILKHELKHSVFQEATLNYFICQNAAPQLTWGKVFSSEDILYQNALLCGARNFLWSYHGLNGFPSSDSHCVWYYLGCDFIRNREQNSVVRQRAEDLHRKIKWHKKWR